MAREAVDMSQHFTLGKLFKVTLPTIGMMVFMSAYGMVDGLFVSNFAGETALAAVNFAYPIPMILGTLGYMFGTGGSAIVAKTRGEGDEERANRQFSLLVYAAAVAGTAFAIIGVLALEPLLRALGAEGELLTQSLLYGRILVLFVPFSCLGYLFNHLLVTAGKPNLAFWVTVATGIANMGLDAIFVAGLNMGVVGAAIGTVGAQTVEALIPLLYFAFHNKSPFRLGRTTLDWRMLGKTCVNGSSEMVGNISSSVLAICYNVQLLIYLGEAGVAAYSVIMYVGFIFVAIIVGFVVGTSPLMSFQYGAQNHAEMQSLFAKCVTVIAVLDVAMFLFTQVAAWPVGQIFVSYDADLRALAVHGLLIFSWGTLVMGFSMYGSSLFTALSNGGVSAVISFVRTMVFEVGAVMLLPGIFGGDSIWYASVVAEVASVILTVILVFRFAKRYDYFPARWRDALK